MGILVWLVMCRVLFRFLVCVIVVKFSCSVLGNCVV